MTGLIGIGVLSPFLVFVCAALQIGTGSYTSDSGIFKWTMIPDDPSNPKTIFYDISAKTSGWAGIGFGESHQMKGSDYIVFSVDQSGAVMRDQNSRKGLIVGTDDGTDLDTDLGADTDTDFGTDNGGTDIDTDTNVVIGGTDIDTDTNVEIGGTDIDTDTNVEIGGTDLDTDTNVVIGGTDIDTDTNVEIGGTDLDTDTNIVIGGTDLDTDTNIVIGGTDIDTDTNIVIGGTDIDTDTNVEIGGTDIDTDTNDVIGGTDIDTDVVIGGTDIERSDDIKKERQDGFSHRRSGGSQDRPADDSIQNFVLVSVTYDDGWINAKFYRDIDTGDAEGDVTIAQTNYILWAIGGGGNTLRHDNTSTEYTQHAHFGAAQWVDKQAGVFKTVNNDRNLQGVHAIVMFIAWAFLVYLGSAVSKLKFLGRPWIIAHVVTQILALCFTITGLILIVVKVSDNFDTHFISTHGIMGIVLIILSCIQPLIGLASHLQRSPDHRTLFPDIFHMVLGYALILYSAAVIFVGLHEYGATSSLYIIAGVWIGLSIIVTAILVVLDASRGTLMDKEREDKDVNTSVRNIFFFLVGFLTLGGLVTVGVFAGYLWKENDTNVLIVYN